MLEKPVRRFFIGQNFSKYSENTIITKFIKK